MDEDERLADYEQNAKEPRRWKIAAEGCFFAAVYLTKGQESILSKCAKKPSEYIFYSSSVLLDQQGHYLQGKCIELYVKCILIKSGVVQCVTKGGKLSKELQSHDLLKLFDKAHFSTTDSEKVTIRKLTEAVIFWGTYPVPVRVESWRPNVDGIEGFMPVWHWSPSDTENYFGLVSRLQETIGEV